MVEVFCFVCAEIKDLDLFKTALKPPYDKPWEIIKVENPTPRSLYQPLVHYTNYSNPEMGIGVCYSCSNSIQIMQKAAKIAGHKVMNLEMKDTEP